MPRHASGSGILQVMRWPLVIAVGAALFLIAGVSTVRETYHVWQVNQEIRGLQAQVTELEGRKGQLKQLIDRLASADELDKQARSRFGLQKPGERVIVLRNAEGQPLSWQEGQKVATEQNVDASPEKQNGPFENPKQWFNYFFPTPTL